MRYTVVKHPTRRGYALHDSLPRYEKGQDIEGVGYVQWNQPRRLPSTTGWYKLKSVAQERADELNECERKRPTVPQPAPVDNTHLAFVDQ